MAKYSIQVDDLLTSKLTKQTIVQTVTVGADTLDEFVAKFNEFSDKMGTRDHFIKVVKLICSDGELNGAELRYVPKEGKN